MQNNYKKYSLFPVYILGFLFAFHNALPTFINSSFLNLFISEKFIGLIYVITSVLIILGYLVLPYILRLIGNYKTALSLIVLNIIALLGLIFSKDSVTTIFFMMINFVTVPLIYFSTDIFLEGFSSNKQTGLVRGVYLTSVNLAWAVSPLIGGFILTGSEYWKIYITALFIILCALLVLITNLHNFKDSNYEAPQVFQTIKEIWKDNNLSNIFLANFLLYFFYAWMTIYTPLYLYKYIGFSWSELGLIFSVMLLPFVIFQLPLGRLADKWLGEKEILGSGFIITAVFTSLISFINVKSFILLAIILFMTRVGACAIEIMCDTYFFKKVNELNANIISFYRMSGSMAYIVSLLFATILFNFLHFEIKYLFFILGLIMLIGLKSSFSIKDTK